MATPNNQSPERAKRKVFSMPVLDGEITLNTQQAQRVFQHGYSQAARALYVLDVVLRVTQKANPKFKEAYDAAIAHAGSLIDTVVGELEKERQRLMVLFDTNNVSGTARYSASQTITYAVSTPLAARFALAVAALDEIVQLLDTLWLAGIITSHANSEGKYGYQRRLLRVVRTLVGYAINARKSARRAGQGDAVKDALGGDDAVAGAESELTESHVDALELSIETDAPPAEEQSKAAKRGKAAAAAA